MWGDRDFFTITWVTSRGTRPGVVGKYNFGDITGYGTCCWQVYIAGYRHQRKVIKVRALLRPSH
ncbi:hypothetical protein Scep_016858 [Stephania cephalantha]|uniref:Uncharacterized protein n=1 Tax=Stephania cephalantha TaxID=152367 RepID=A0AAP0NV40_9MAGN